MPNNSLKKQTVKNFLISARQLVDVKMFQHLYVTTETDEEKDVLNSGELSCAFVVSSLLAMYGLIDHAHATVATTLEEMKKAGWQETKRIKPGVVVCWPEYEGNEHIGIVVGEGECVSNSAEARVPTLHGLKLKDGRLPSKFFVHPDLE